MSKVLLKNLPFTDCLYKKVMGKHGKEGYVMSLHSYIEGKLDYKDYLGVKWSDGTMSYLDYIHADLEVL